MYDWLGFFIWEFNQYLNFLIGNYLVIESVR